MRLISDVKLLTFGSPKQTRPGQLRRFIPQMFFKVADRVLLGGYKNLSSNLRQLAPGWDSDCPQL